MEIVAKSDGFYFFGCPKTAPRNGCLIIPTCAGPCFERPYFEKKGMLPPTTEPKTHEHHILAPKLEHTMLLLFTILQPHPPPQKSTIFGTKTCQKTCRIKGAGKEVPKAPFGASWGTPGQPKEPNWIPTGLQKDPQEGPKMSSR